MRLRKGDHTVLVSPEGGTILQWQYREHTLLGPMRAVRVGREIHLRGGTHWCYPNFGTPRAGNKWSSLQHGFLRHKIMDVAPVSERVFGHAFRFEMPSESSETKTKVAVGVIVDELGVKAWLCAENHGKESEPVLPALHPYFATPYSGLVVMMDGKVQAQVLPFRTAGVTEGVSAEARILPRTGKVSVELRNLGNVEMELPDHCTHIVVWSDKPEAYVCVEPVFGEPGTFGLDNGVWLGTNEQICCEVNFLFKPF